MNAKTRWIETDKKGKVKQCLGKTYYCRFNYFSLQRKCLTLLNAESKINSTKINPLNKSNHNRFTSVDNPVEIKQYLNQWQEVINDVSEELDLIQDLLDFIDEINIAEGKLDDVYYRVKSDAGCISLAFYMEYLYGNSDSKKQILDRVAADNNITTTITQKDIANSGKKSISISIDRDYNESATYVTKLENGKYSTLDKKDKKTFKELLYDSLDEINQNVIRDYTEKQINKGKIMANVNKEYARTLLKDSLNEIVLEIKTNHIGFLNAINSNGDDLDDIVKAYHSISIINGIQDFVNSLVSNENINVKAKLLLDENGKPQSAMIYKQHEDSLSINYLATAPWNIINNLADFNKVKGAGTSMVLSAIEESIKNGTEGRIQLTPIYSARKFYRKLGFLNEGSASMVLSTEDAKKLQDKYRNDETVNA